ncbi:hypothetical protein Hanom_Chr05g00422411 [Helianthus anomalus]
MICEFGCLDVEIGETFSFNLSCADRGGLTSSLGCLVSIEHRTVRSSGSNSKCMCFSLFNKSRSD